MTKVDASFRQTQAPNSDVFPLTEDLLAPIQGYRPLTPVSQHVESKAYSVTNDINPLIAAAAPLFSLVKKFRNAQKKFDLTSLQQIIIHEVQAFESAALNQNYAYDTILIARYCVCALLDETIYTNSWGGEDWQEHCLLAIFGTDNLGDNGFYHLLDRLLQAAKDHLDLLELMYTCLSLGYTGQHTPNNSEQTDDETMLTEAIDLDGIIDKLYHCIRELRGDAPKALSPPVRNNITNSKPIDTNRNRKPIPLWLLFLLTSAVVVLLYFGFGYIQRLTQAQLYQTLTELNVMHASTNTLK